MKRIDALGRNLSHMNDIQKLPDLVFRDECLRQSLDLCQEPLEELRDVVEDLDRQINAVPRLKRTIGALKSLLKKENIKDLEKRLNTSTMTLLVAYNMYTT